MQPPVDVAAMWKEIMAGAAFILLWWRQGNTAGKIEQKVETALENATEAKTKSTSALEAVGMATNKSINALDTAARVSEAVALLQSHVEESDFCTKDECERCRVQCRESIQDKLMLALEKRDREFDRKFSTICQGTTEIKTELRRQ